MAMTSLCKCIAKEDFSVTDEKAKGGRAHFKKGQIYHWLNTGNYYFTFVDYLDRSKGVHCGSYNGFKYRFSRSELEIERYEDLVKIDFELLGI